MCYHFSLKAPIADIVEHYARLYGMDTMDVAPGLFQEDIFEERTHVNAFAYPAMPVISEEEPHRVQAMQWGLIPRWVRTREEALKFRSNTLNARSETVFEKPSYRQCMMRQRCVVPADAFYEYHHEGKRKIPYRIRLRHRELFSFAGIHEQWVDTETGEALNTFSILTRAAGPLLAEIHNARQRQPVILLDDAETAWLDASCTRERIEQLFAPIDDALFETEELPRIV